MLELNSTRDFHISPEPIDGFAVYPVCYLLQCQLYFESLMEPKLDEYQWLEFLLSRLASPAHQWAEVPITKGTGGLSNVAEFVGLLRKVFDFTRT